MSHQRRKKTKKKNNNNRINNNVSLEDNKSLGSKVNADTENAETIENKTVENNTKEKTIKYDKILSIVFAAVVIITGAIIGLLNNYRPFMSEIEQRNLAAYPEVSLASVLDGSYFSKLDLWYSDTYPLREKMIEVNNDINSLYGFEMETKMVGSDIAKDEIPDLPVVSENKGNKKPMVSNSVNSASVNEAFASAASDNNTAASGNSISMDFVYQPEVEIKIPETTAMEAEIKQYIQQNLYVKDGAAYSKYYFSLNSATKYTTALENAAIQLEGRCNVINILVPNQSGAMLPYDEMIALGGSNQIDAIHYYYGQYENVYTVDTIDTLREHQDEYLYFRTDHHWTPLGAYYVYRNFCKLKGFTPHQLSYYEELTFDPFLGSFYSELRDPEMAANPDYVKAYVPRGTNTLVYWDVAGVRHDWQVVTDVSKWNMYSGYSAFVGGDKPLAIIENPEIRNGSSCLVIKESYGNCFIPFLVDHYQTVFIMDCRYSTENYIKFVLDNNIQDLIFINNITIIGSTGLCNRIASNLKYEE